MNSSRSTNSLSYTIADTITMLRRVLRHMLRKPFSTLLGTLGTPIFLLVLMYNLFAGVVQLSGTAGGNTRYIDYLTPGLILITSIYGMGIAALRVNTDMTQGIIARFRTMSIARVSVLNGHVLGSTLGTLFSISVITVLAFFTGFRPTTNPLEWLAVFGLITLFVIADAWLAVAVGVASKSPEGANSALFLLYILPFLSSAFIPTQSMTPVVAWIAENQPFSPIIDTMRGLLLGTPIGNRGLVAILWCLALG
ncbi:MAG TPA: ABC transporter permease, partial [Phototrophicaceae bacterium]|nr:ABC transporter permease [Phototrophicaceae bacterium]